MKISFETVTPTEAKKLLKRNLPYNRSVSARVVELYARDMKEGRWNEDCPSPISLSEKGYLLDGQHRLMAVIEANMPVQFLVARDVDESTFEYIDNGKRREPWQFLDGTQVKNRQAMAKFLCSLDMGSSLSQAIRGTVTVTRQELLEYEAAHREEIIEAVNAGLRVREVIGVGSNLAYGGAVAVQVRLGNVGYGDFTARTLNGSTNFAILIRTITRAYLSAKAKPNAAWVCGTMLQYIEAEKSSKSVKSFNKQEAMLDKYSELYRKKNAL